MCWYSRYSQDLKWTAKKKQPQLSLYVLKLNLQPRFEMDRNESHNFPYMCRNCTYEKDLKCTAKSEKDIIIQIWVKIVGTTKTLIGQQRKKP